ncbi:type III-B CRISPR module-associated protein Cmr3 [Pasteurella skyensis]|uniref:Type III-B CRISPR module-associated protein Cmr3 n=1 Tax=Phocoenobacter skyensis TaxID=97481 RepID=A0AAJ6NCW8_9PAST|nr:type III-B CRISPR module-associated protein Cmr3 [Pasteurella skyensis]MDP8170527.1 type III-B CRISPR module-associated protein Cmr3 [Pasteurella skyensis]MDP8174511.1 type III-B CRISPR module-associated protein Cmr3 [Pasteurella skyensis]
MSHSFQHYLFEPIDSWFFREARSMDSSGANTLSSLFPPPTKTLLGAIRHHIGEKYNADKGKTWKDLETGELRKIIGYGEDYEGSSFQAQGSWLFYNDQLYFPAPACLVKKADNQGYGFFQLKQDEKEKILASDMGNKNFVRCDAGDKPLENYWLSRTGWELVLRGMLPAEAELLAKEDILIGEPRLGIGLENKSTQKGMLYTTEHIRLKDKDNKDIKVYLGVDIGEENKNYLPDSQLIRFGGEARMAEMKKDKNDDQRFSLPEMTLFDESNCDNNEVILVVYLLTPMPVANLEKVINNAQTQIMIDGIQSDIETAIIGKVQRFGGWDMVNHKPSPLRSYLPAGSCWYIRCNPTTAKELLKKQGAYLTRGNEKVQGYGQILIGLNPTISK